MDQQQHSQQKVKSGRFARRMLWIPAIGAVLVAGYLAVQTPQHGHAATMAQASTPAFVTIGPDEVVYSPPLPNTFDTPPRVDATIAEHQALDPVGAGHDVAR